MTEFESAIQKNEPIAIYGDYDVDGVTSTALLVETLTFFNANVRGYIPNRFEEGYGLNNEAMDKLKADGVQLVITVDCGIRSPNEALHARTLGLDLIISDHHHPAEGDLPAAFAVINPKQPGDMYPDKDLAGVGIAYKIAEALLGDGQQTMDNGQPSRSMSTPLLVCLILLRLAQLQTLRRLWARIAFLFARDCRQMKQTTRQGLFSLAAVSDIKLEKVNCGKYRLFIGTAFECSRQVKRSARRV